MLHTHLHIHVGFTSSTNGRNLENFQRRYSLVNRGALERKVLSLLGFKEMTLVNWSAESIYVPDGDSSLPSTTPNIKLI
jgi:hypothetical protein